MNKKKQNAIPYTILAVCAALLFFRSFYGFCWSDEPFYFSTAYRFYQGDSLFLHEWFPTQLSSALLLPLFHLYMAAAGSTDGILLFFRICYVAYSLCVSLAVFRILNYRHGAALSLACSLCCLFYAHLNIATLSYYTMSVSFYLLSLLLLYHYYNRLRAEETEEKRYLAAAGVFFALAVLCLPPLCAAYFAVMAFLGLLALFCKRYHKEAFLKHNRIATVCLFTFYGICIPAILFLFYLFSKISLGDLLSSLPYVLTDEEHITSLVYPFKKFFIGINEVYGYAAYAGYALAAITLLFGRKIKERQRLLLTLFNMVLFLIYFAAGFGHTGYIFTAIALFGVSQYFLTVRRNKLLFFLLYVPGLIFSMVFSYSSNGYLYILSIGHFVSALASIVFICDYATEVFASYSSVGETLKKAAFLASLACAASAVIQTMALRIAYVYRDAPLSQLTEEIACGPAKGLHTTPKHADLYRAVYDTIEAYTGLGSGLPGDTPVFFTKLLPWGYLATPLPCGAPTTWRTPFDSKRLEPYYSVNPDRIPGIIFVLDEEYGSYETSGDVVADPSPNENEIGGYLLDAVTRLSYLREETPCGQVYLRPDLAGN